MPPQKRRLPGQGKAPVSRSDLTDYPARPLPRGCPVHDAGALSAVVVRAQKSQRLLDLDGSLPKEPASGRLCSGDRSKKTCQRLWEAIPEGYRSGHCFTDFWAAYAAVIPEEQHTAVGKETGETAHVERWNNTLRQRLARFVRMTLSFSKSEIMHEACLLLFLHRYNLDKAILLK